MNEIDFAIGVVMGGLGALGLFVAIRLVKSAIAVVKVKIQDYRMRQKHG